jgi:hypothetical protein
MERFEQIMKRKKIKVQKKKTVSGAFLILGIIIAALIILVISYKLNQSQDIRSRAEDDDPNFCQNHCKDPTCRGKPDFYDEECCLRIQQTGDPFECPWPQRGWCMPEHCNIPEGVNRQRCASPREGWCNKCRERKCPGFASNPTSIPPTVSSSTPTVIIPSTVPPVITSIPTIIPTDISVISPSLIPTQNIWPSNPISPTRYLYPTESQINNPTQYLSPTIIPSIYYPSPVLPTATPTPIPRKFSFPNILPTKEKVDNFLEGLKKSVVEFIFSVLP